MNSMNELVLRQVKIISNSRIRLKPVGTWCIDLIGELATNDEVTRYLRWEPPRNMQEAEAFVLDCERKSSSEIEYYWGIETVEQQKPVGLMRIFSVDRTARRFALGTWLLPIAWGQGVNQLAKGIILESMFMLLGFEIVWCRAQAENIRSRRALEKLCFRQTEYRKNGRCIRGIYYDEVFYELTKEEYLKSGRWGYDPALQIISINGSMFALAEEDIL
jgi:RimJ/RimL family protein N-acetyltransferase